MTAGTRFCPDPALPYSQGESRAARYAIDLREEQR